MNFELRADLTVPSGVRLPEGPRKQVLGELALLLAQLTCPGCW